MKKRIFTSALALSMLCSLGLSGLQAQTLNTGTGTGWDVIFQPGSPLLINENFQSYEFFHTDENADQGNSDNTLDETTMLPVAGYKTMSVELTLGSSHYTAPISFEECAFAPEWPAAYAYSDALAANDLENSENYNTGGVSNGFVEISREAIAMGGNLPTTRGYLVVDLRKIDFVEGIQYAHSSCGGNKRGITVEFSLDDGASWDTLRYQPGGAAWNGGFTYDFFTQERTYNGYRCDPSAYGMLWEDPIYESNVMLRFLEGGGQTIRMHDLKVYGDLPTSVKKIKENTIKIWTQDNFARLS